MIRCTQKKYVHAQGPRAERCYTPTPRLGISADGAQGYYLHGLEIFPATRSTLIWSGLSTITMANHVLLKRLPPSNRARARARTDLCSITMCSAVFCLVFVSAVRHRDSPVLRYSSDIPQSCIKLAFFAVVKGALHRKTSVLWWGTLLKPDGSTAFLFPRTPARDSKLGNDLR